MHKPMEHRTERKGFTMIEVVLVLAIAGLLLLMVFVALPSLQRSQRDTQRRQDMARLITAIQNYRTNNGGEYPYKVNCGAPHPRPSGDYMYACGEYGFDKNFIKNYLENDGDTFSDPSTGETYTFVYKDPDSGQTYSFVRNTAGLIGLCRLYEGSNRCNPDPSGLKLNLKEGAIVAYRYSRCNGGNPEYASDAMNRVAFVIKLESGGTYCVDF